MNKISVESYETPFGYKEYYITIDQKPIYRYIDEYTAAGLCDRLKEYGSALGMYPAWGKDLDWEGDRRFIWELIISDEPMNLPILVCEEDPDFSCIVIIVKVRKDDKHVYWDRIGLLDHKNENFETEKRSGIVCLDKYSEDDWEKYGDNIALAKVNSPEWDKWISENWEEELLRRRRNYTYPYMQNDDNIIWINDLNFVFGRHEYNNCIRFYKQESGQ